MPHTLSRRLLTIFSPLTWAVAALAATPLCAEDVTPVVDDAPASADATFDLRYKLSTGTVLRYDIDHRAAIRSTIDETTQVAQTKTESTKAWKVTDVLPTGEIEFMSVVERVHMMNHLPDRAPVEYDSEKDETPPPGYEDTARAINVPLSVIRMTDRGEIKSRNVKLQQPNADKDAQIVIRLPDKPVAIGATWDEPQDLVVSVEGGGTKSIQTRRHYELASVANGIASIDVTYQILSPIDAKIEAQLVQKLMKGTVRFDVDAGHIDSQLCEVDKRVLGFAGPTSSMHYVMRMEEKLAEAKLAASAKLEDHSLLTKQTKLSTKVKTEEKKEVEEKTEIAAKPEPPESPATTAPSGSDPSRSNSPRGRSRSATHTGYGNPTHYR
jgi:hypothetical protein